MLQYNTQACDILFNGLCPEEFNKISRLENAKEIWDTLVDMHEGTESVKESKLDVLQSQLEKFKMKDVVKESLKCTLGLLSSQMRLPA